MIFYTYLWLRYDGTPYYVGKGRDNRGFINDGHCVHCPDDSSRILIQYHPSEQEAFEAEVFFISYFGRKDLGTGILYNRTDGGEGNSGYIYEVKNLVGKRFGKLVVTSRAHKTFAGGIHWNCLCDCGNTSVVAIGDLNGKKGTRSCGCLRKGMQNSLGWRFDFINNGIKMKMIPKGSQLPEGWSYGRGKPSWNHGVRKYELAGQTFGRWLVISKVIGKGWLCRCSCSNERVIPTENLVNNGTKSCGCWNLEALHSRKSKEKQNVTCR
jgi:hypothetical protein